MAANSNPIYTVSPNARGAQLTASNTRSDGNGTIGTDIYLVFTASASGGYCSSVRFMPWATVAGTATTATVLRVYISQQTSGATTSSNTWLIAEVAAASQSADSASAAVYPIEVPINKAITANYTVLVSMHHAPAANTGWVATAFGGNYE